MDFTGLWDEFHRRPRASVDTVQVRVELDSGARVSSMKAVLTGIAGCLPSWVAVDGLDPGGNARGWLVTIQDPTIQILNAAERACSGRWGVSRFEVVSLDVALDWTLRGADKRRNPDRCRELDSTRAEFLLGWIRASLYGAGISGSWRIPEGGSTSYLGDFERLDFDGKLLIPSGHAFRAYFKTRDFGRDLDPSDFRVRLELRVRPSAIGALSSGVAGFRFERLAGLFRVGASDFGHVRESLKVWNTLHLAFADVQCPVRADAMMNREIKESLKSLSRRWNA